MQKRLSQATHSPTCFCRSRSLKSTSPRQYLGDVTSWLPFLKHDGWSCWIQKLVSHSWGQATLVASQFTTAFSAHRPRPFFTLFRQVDDWLRRYFVGVYQLIDAEDMRMFIDGSSLLGGRRTFVPCSIRFGRTTSILQCV